MSLVMNLKSESDPVSIFEIFNMGYGSKILTASVVYFDTFNSIGKDKISFNELRGRLRVSSDLATSRDLNIRPDHFSSADGLSVRSARVLTTALCSYGLLHRHPDDTYELSSLAKEHLLSESSFDVSDYIHLAIGADGVRQLVERLANDDPGIDAQYIKRDEGASVFEDNPELTQWLTERLVGRCKNTALVLPEQAPLGDARHLLYVGAGSGVYGAGYVMTHPNLRLTVLELPNVLPVTRKYMREYGVEDRVDFIEGDMFDVSFNWPACDAILFSNLLHDWGEEKCRTLINRAHRALNDSGRLIIHDVLLNDSLDGPFHVATYSVVLFFLTEGRAYSRKEYESWLQESGFRSSEPRQTRVHCFALTATKV